MPKFYVRHAVVIRFEHQVEADSVVDAENAAVALSDRYIKNGKYRVDDDMFETEEVK